MKIYTKTGDTGLTSLLGGTRVPKHHLRIEAYGTIDELNSHIGFLRDHQISQSSTEQLLEVQDRLFTIGSRLATDPSKTNVKIPVITEEDVHYLEIAIDDMNEQLPEMKSFILPGGHLSVSACHITRCVCRRAERLIVHLDELNKVDGVIIRYINRLSDYLFVLARKLAKESGSIETPWKPRM